jgi:hypothetical protein
MKIKMQIDQAAALLRGHDAPTSTEMVEVDPAELTETERAVLAAVMLDGHDTTRRGLATDTDEFVGESGSGYSGAPVAPMFATRPGLEGLREAINNLLVRWTTARAARATAIADGEARQRERVAAARTVQTETVTVGLTATGNVAQTLDYALVTDELELPVVPYVDSLRVTWPVEGRSCEAYVYPDPAVYDALRTEREAERAAAIEGALPTLRARLAAELARIATEKAADKAAYDALYARLPEGLRARHADGFASDTEITKALTRILRTDAGYDERPRGWQDSEALDVLTDAEHAVLVAERDRTPDGARITPRLVWDHGARIACDVCEYEYEGPKSDCDDCEQARDNEERILDIRWTSHGIDVRAVVPLTGRD